MQRGDLARFWLLMVACPFAAACTHSEDTRPTIVMIVVDTLRADHLGCYGYRKDTSPNINALAARGTLFDRAVSQAPWTAPSIASLFTGKPAAAHGAIGKLGVGADAKLAREQVTLAEELQAAGYHTVGMVTNPNIRAKNGFAQGFDVFREKMLAPAKEVTDWGLAQLSTESQQPLFLYLHYMDPHSPYQPPPLCRQRFVKRRAGRFHRNITTEDLNRINFSGFHPTPDELQFMIGLYDAEIACTDIEIGRLVDALGTRLAKSGPGTDKPAHPSEGTQRPVLLLLTADHGEELLDHGGAFHGYTAYRELTHVPLILVGAQIPQRRVRALVREMDITPTLLDLAQISSSERRGGASLRPYLTGDPEVRAAVTEAEMQTPYRGVKLEAIETDEWKLVRDDVQRQTLLFDLTKDPFEQTNVADQHPERAAELEVQLDQILTALPRAPRPNADIDPATRELQRQLGY